MTVVVNVFLVGMCVLYLWQLWAGVHAGGSLAAPDRLKLLTLVLETALIFFLARILVTWTPTTSWLWSADFAMIGVGAALAMWRARDLRWVTAATTRRTRLRRVLAPVYAVLLAALTGLAYATLL